MTDTETRSNCRTCQSCGARRCGKGERAYLQRMQEITCRGRIHGGGAVPGAVPVGSGGRRCFPSSDSGDAAATLLDRHLYTARPPPPTQRRTDGRAAASSEVASREPRCYWCCCAPPATGSTRAPLVNMLGLARRVPVGLAFASGQGARPRGWVVVHRRAAENKASKAADGAAVGRKGEERERWPG
jgi:hypothetical protein